MKAFLGLPRNWSLLTKLIAALAAAMLPMALLTAALVWIGLAPAGQREPVLMGWTGMILVLLIWLSAVVMGWFAIHRLVTGPLLSLERLMADYGQSSDPARTRLRAGNRDHGSAEINALAAGFDAMADQIDRHSRELAGALLEQQRLTREVHHRVKNNLQIISSLLSLQSRDAATPEAVQTYAVIQARIAALTHVHRWMYDDATSNGVDLKSLVGELCLGLQSSLVSPNHPHVVMTSDTQTIIVHPDVAVPVAFLLTELASLAALYGAPGPLHVAAAASHASARITFSVTAAGFKDADRIAATSVTPTARIIHGMARQLRSALVHDPAAGRYSVTFSAFAPRPVS